MSTGIFRLQAGRAFENFRGCRVPVGHPKDSVASLRGLGFAFLESLRQAAFVGIAYHSNWESSYRDPLAAEGGIQPGQLPAPVEILMPGAGRS